MPAMCRYHRMGVSVSASLLRIALIIPKLFCYKPLISVWVDACDQEQVVLGMAL